MGHPTRRSIPVPGMRPGALARIMSPLTYADPAAPVLERALINLIEVISGRSTLVKLYEHWRAQWPLSGLRPTGQRDRTGGAQQHRSAAPRARRAARRRDDRGLPGGRRLDRAAQASAEAVRARQRSAMEELRLSPDPLSRGDGAAALFRRSERADAPCRRPGQHGLADRAAGGRTQQAARQAAAGAGRAPDHVVGNGRDPVRGARHARAAPKGLSTRPQPIGAELPLHYWTLNPLGHDYDR